MMALLIAMTSRIATSRLKVTQSTGFDFKEKVMQFSVRGKQIIFFSGETDDIIPALEDVFQCRIKFLM
jgi:hypothetical protein